MRNDSSMLTLDEFLRETSAASATRDEAERHLNHLLSLRRRIGIDRPGSESTNSGAAYGATHRERRRDWVSISPPHLDGPDGAATWRTLVEHTPAGRARILSALPGSTGSLAAAAAPPPPLRSVPYTYTPVPPANQDSFDTLVGQIRRIGALQDFMLSGIVEGESVPVATAASSSGVATEEYPSTAGARVGGNILARGDIMARADILARGDILARADVLARGESATGTGGEEAERNAVAALRVREARLRAMQMRIDLLASEFALLRNTRRELRWVSSIFSILASIYLYRSKSLIIRNFILGYS